MFNYLLLTRLLRNIKLACFTVANVKLHSILLLVPVSIFFLYTVCVSTLKTMILTSNDILYEILSKMLYFSKYYVRKIENNDQYKRTGTW